MGLFAYRDLVKLGGIALQNPREVFPVTWAASFVHTAPPPRLTWRLLTEMRGSQSREGGVWV